MNEKLPQQMRPLVLDAINKIGDYERAEGYLRYEKIRTLHLSQFQVLCARSLRGERFDDMIDEMIVGES